MTKNEMLDLLKTITNMEDDEYDHVLSSLLNMAEMIALSIIYPFHKERDDLEVPQMYHYWIVMAAKEIYDKKDFGSGLRSYSENGISFMLEETTGILSYGLVSQLLPKARVPE